MISNPRNYMDYGVDQRQTRGYQCSLGAPP